MLASEFFKKGSTYLCIKSYYSYFTEGKSYKCFDLISSYDNKIRGVIIEINIETVMLQHYHIKYGTKKVNGLGNSYFDQDIRNIFKCIDKKNHLPKWF